MPLDSTLPPSVWRVSQPIPSFLSELSIPLFRVSCDPRLPHFPILFPRLSTPSQQPTEKWKWGSKEGKSGSSGVLQDWLWPIGPAWSSTVQGFRLMEPQGRGTEGKKRLREDSPSHLMGCVRRAVFRSSTTWFLVSVSSSSNSYRFCIWGPQEKGVEVTLSCLPSYGRLLHSQGSSAWGGHPCLGKGKGSENALPLW